MNEDLTQASETFGDRIAALESAVSELRQRNKRVEADKAWETSLARKAVVSFLTYAITASVFWALGVPTPFRNALIPLAGYVISTLTIPWAKSRWVAALNSPDRPMQN
jgi:hypothetical protein